MESVWDPKVAWRNHELRTWKSIVHGKEFMKHIIFKLGSGKNINFWEDVWYLGLVPYEATYEFFFL